MRRATRPPLENQWTEVHRALLDLAAIPPGENPQAVIRARVLLYGCRIHEDSDIRRRSTDVLWAFEDWFSARGWNRAHQRGDRARETIRSLIERLHVEIDAHYHPAQRDTSWRRNDVL